MDSSPTALSDGLMLVSKPLLFTSIPTVNLSREFHFGASPQAADQIGQAAAGVPPPLARPAAGGQRPHIIKSTVRTPKLYPIVRNYHLAQQRLRANVSCEAVSQLKLDHPAEGPLCSYCGEFRHFRTIGLKLISGV